MAAKESTSRVGWRSTAGCLDEKILLSDFQTALMDEIKVVKGQTCGGKTELYDGSRVFSSKTLNVYRFLSDDADDWIKRKSKTELIVKVGEEEFFGRLDSADKTSITVAFEVDLGPVIEEAYLRDSSFFLLEKLNSKLENIKTGQRAINSAGAMKLFGFVQPDSFDPLSLDEQRLAGFGLNCEQEIAVRKSLSQEVTFVWGPPGTGKTKTLTLILGLLVSAGKRVLLSANTNAAVDEILRKFLDDKDNFLLAEKGMIVRLGIPSFEDEKMDLVMPKRILEKRNRQSQNLRAIYQKEIDLNNRQIADLEAKENALSKNQHLIDSLRSDFSKTQANINDFVKKVERARINQENLLQNLMNAKKTLEEAQTAGVFKRLFSGLNKEQAEKDIRNIENQYRIHELEFQSYQKNLDDLRIEERKLSEKIKASESIVSEDGEILTLPIITKMKVDLLEKNRKQEAEILALEQNKQDEQKTIVKESRLVAATIARACIDPSIMAEKFDALVVDEASMAALPNVFYLAGSCATHYVVSGDFRQLSPIAQGKTSAVQRWMKRDIFTQAGVLQSVDADRYDQRLVMLREQYRMHPLICNLISEAVYDGKLKTPEDVAISKEQVTKLPPFEGKALIFCDTASSNPYIARPKNSFSRISPYSAVVSANLAIKCIEESGKRKCKIKVGIVSPYNAQAKLISRILIDKEIDHSQVMSSTVHRFQGAERDCIIFDLVEGEPLDPGKLAQGSFKRSEPGRLINVAISRGKGKFILVGNSDYIEKHFSDDDAVKQILAQIKANGEVTDSCIVDYSSNRDNSNSDLVIRDTTFTAYNQTTFYPAFLQDMKNAKTRIVIFSPFVSRKRVETLLKDFYQIARKGVPIYVITRKAPKNDVIDDLIGNNVHVIFASKNFGFEEFEKFHFKLAIVDNSVIYYGSLNILSQVESAESMIAIRTKKAVSLLVRSFGIDSIIKEYKNQNLKNTMLNQPQNNLVQVEQGAHQERLS